MPGNEAEVGMKCIRYMLFTTNFMFTLIGFLLISVGSTITAIYNNFEGFMEQHFFSPAALLISIGVIIFFVSLFGCFAAIKKSTCLVNMYGLLLTIILILEISAAIAAYAMRDDIPEYIEDKMKEGMEEYYDLEDDDSGYMRYTWDQVQSGLHCCGIQNSDDWLKYGKIPTSCNDSNGETYVTGCLYELSYLVSECASLVGTGGICVAIVQSLGVIFAFMLAKSIRRFKTEAEIQRQANQRMYAQLAMGNNEKPTPVIYIPANIQEAQA